MSDCGENIYNMHPLSLLSGVIGGKKINTKKDIYLLIFYFRSTIIYYQIVPTGNKIVQHIQITP